MCKKLKAIGAATGTIRWFESFLDSRYIETMINGMKSEEIFKENEIPEGGPLSASLFIIAVIDINLFVKNSTISGFLDDFIQTTSHSDLKTAVKMAEEDSQAVVDYFKLNRLAIQSSKTALVVIRPNKTAGDQIKIKIDGKEIVQQPSFKLLGVEIDDKLNFDNHVGRLVR